MVEFQIENPKEKENYKQIEERLMLMRDKSIIYIHR